jgi:hypothetical protein
LSFVGRYGSRIPSVMHISNVTHVSQVPNTTAGILAIPDHLEVYGDDEESYDEESYDEDTPYNEKDISGDLLC